MDRIGFLKRHVHLGSAVALEIGALDKPVLDPRSPGVHYLDHLDTPALKEKYGVDPAVDKDRIVTVDYVWSGGGIAGAVTDGRRFDLIVASHVFEHFSNPVQWLLDLKSLLTPDGKVFLALPDRRFTFDLLRRDTALSDLVGWYLRGVDKPTAEQIFDYFAYVAHVDCDRARTEPDYRSPPPMFERVQAIDLARTATTEDRYVDAHCSVFTPFGFVELCRALEGLGLFPYRFHGFAPTEPGDIEFVALLQAHDVQPAPQLDNARLQALAVEAGYAGGFGGGRFAQALEADAALAARYRDLVATARAADIEACAGQTAGFPDLDPRLHHERPGWDDPRVPRAPTKPAHRSWADRLRHRLTGAPVRET